MSQDKPAGLNARWVGTAIKYSSRANTALYRATRGRLGGKWRIAAGLRKPVPMCLLTTTGRKTGKSRTVPLLYLRDGDTVVVVASHGGREDHPLWYRNIVADPKVTVQIRDDVRNMLAREASPSERDRLWAALTELYADFDTYQQWAERTIPVVICEPV